MSRKVYGIDLGTTYSAIAHITDLGSPEVIQNFEGEQATPSVVYFEAPDSAIVGAEAKRVAHGDPDNTCQLIKRQMGTEFPQEFQGVTYTPEAISALILRELVKAANAEAGVEDTGEPVDVVITIPAYFGVQEREATKQAGTIAGLNIVGIVTEPVAAALSVGVRTDAGSAGETVMVYDLGGGTFDTTVMTTGNGSIEVIAIDGDRKLGGADWDSVLVDLVVDKFIAQADLGDDDPRFDPDFMMDIRLEAEALKKTLTRRESGTIRPAYEGNKATVEITRNEFEQATAHLIAQTTEIAERTVATARRKKPDVTIDRVLLVGGSSRMPMVRAALRDRLGWEAQDTEFDLAVAKGAAIYGQASVNEVLVTGDEKVTPANPFTSGPQAYLPGRASSLSVTNVLSRGVGCDLLDKNGQRYIEFFARANDTIPRTAAPIHGGTVSRHQADVEIGIFEQSGDLESTDPEDNRLLKNTLLDLPNKTMPAGAPIDVTADISSEGIITMVVTDVTSGASVTLEATVSVLDEEQVAAETSKVNSLTLRS